MRELVANFGSRSKANSRGAACGERLDTSAFKRAGADMRKLLMAGGLIAAALAVSGEASAGPWEDGMAAYNRGDYVPAIQIFAPSRAPATPGRKPCLERCITAGRA